MATLSKTAWVLHELGLAAGFGSNLFGLIALNPAMATIQSKRERGKVTHVAWDRYRAVNGTSLAIMASTWFVGRLFLSRHELRALRRTAPGILVAKDVLVGGALVAGVGAMAVGQVLDQEIAASNQPLHSGSRPYSETRDRVAKLQRLSDGLGRFNVLLNAAVLTVTALLAMKTRR